MSRIKKEQDQKRNGKARLTRTIRQVSSLGTTSRRSERIIR